MAEVYKQGQGVLTRRFAFWILAALLIWGGRSLYNWLVNVHGFFATLLVEEKGRPGYVIPVLETRFDVAFATAFVLTAAALFALGKVLNRPRAGEFLIETDAELKKVTWPSWKDAWGSTVVVLLFVVILAAFLVASNQIIGKVMNLIMGV